MPTFDECREQGRILAIGGKLSPSQQPMRLLAMVPGLREWIQQVLVPATTDGYIPGSATPKEQLADFFNRFVSGDSFKPPLPHEMSPTGNGVWRFRTDDVRIVGWFPRRGFFVIADMELKANCTRKRDEEMLQRTLDCRRELDLDGGRFEPGLDIDGLL